MPESHSAQWRKGRNKRRFGEKRKHSREGYGDETVTIREFNPNQKSRKQRWEEEQKRKAQKLQGLRPGNTRNEQVE